MKFFDKGTSVYSFVLKKGTRDFILREVEISSVDRTDFIVKSKFSFFINRSSFEFVRKRRVVTYIVKVDNDFEYINDDRMFTTIKQAKRYMRRIKKDVTHRYDNYSLGDFE